MGDLGSCRGHLEGTLRPQRYHQDHASGAHKPRTGRRARDRTVRPPWCSARREDHRRDPRQGLAGDEMDERVYLVIDGVDGRVHHVEFPDGSHLKDAGRDMIVEITPATSGPRAADRYIAPNVGEQDGIYRPSQHLGRIREQFEREGRDSESFVRSHVRRLEALRRAGHVERIDEDHWKVPGDILERGQAYDRTRGGDGPRIKILSSEKLERQIATECATWLDRELTAREPQVIADSGFGRDVRNALQRRAEHLVKMGYATARNGAVQIPAHTVASLEQ